MEDKSTEKKQVNQKLIEWQDRLSKADAPWQDEVSKMDKREKTYGGDRDLRDLVPGDKNLTDKQATHVRNITFENIESQVSTSIPQPKVTAWRQEDEKKAQIIEHWIRNELDRQNFEQMNDMAERTVPIQGGCLFLQEWDNTIRSHTTVGAQVTKLIHPKQLAPQPGIYTGIEDMDWVILKIYSTKEAVRRKYGVDVEDQTESEPDIRASGNEDHSEDAVTVYVGFEKNDTGGINKYCWCNNVELEDLENYQARRLPTCRSCGKIQPMRGQVISAAVNMPKPEPKPEDYADTIAAGRGLAEVLAQQMMGGAETEEAAGFMPGVQTITEELEPMEYDGGPCPWCGGTEWETREQEYEEVYLPIKTKEGTEIPGLTPGLDEMGMPVMKATRIPFYRPDVYPIVLQRSVSVYGQLLGNSDVDAIEDQQNTTNRIEKKIVDRLLKAGTRITLPPKAHLSMDPNDGERWYLTDLKDKQYISVYEFSGNIQYYLTYLSQVYEESRQILGITDSFQGRKDPTATSGKAKEYAAAMSAGRLESKRIMKKAAYAKIFELMFKLQLANADEPRPISWRDSKGNTIYGEFNRYDFLEQDADGQWYWNDRFLFSCDDTAPLANNREAMWQETRMNLQSGAFGNPSETETLILFWGKMEMLHYPGAGETKRFLEERMEREMAAAQAQAMAMAQAQGMGTGTAYPAVRRELQMQL